MSRPGTSHVDQAIRELLDSERKYVHDLEELHKLKGKIEQKELVPEQIVHEIFLNVNAILGFQQNFLAKMETISSQLQDIGRWGFLFTDYEEAFSVYYPFIANSSKGIALAMREFQKFASVGYPVFADSNTLDAFLRKPLQRLNEYPVLLKNLRDNSNADEEAMADISSGIEVANRVLRSAAAAVDRETRYDALADFCERVRDWKNWRVDHFGDLLLCGQFAVAFNDQNSQNSQKKMKTYNLYLFEQTLVCGKEIKPKKTPLPKLLFESMFKASQSNEKKPELFLKGKVFMKHIREVSATVQQGFYNLDIFFNSGDKADSIDNSITIQFPNEEVGRKWRLIINGRRNNVIG